MTKKNRRARSASRPSHRRRRSSKADRIESLGDLPRAAGRAGSMLLSSVRSVLPDPSRWTGW